MLEQKRKSERSIEELVPEPVARVTIGGRDVPLYPPTMKGRVEMFRNIRTLLRDVPSDRPLLEAIEEIVAEKFPEMMVAWAEDSGTSVTKEDILSSRIPVLQTIRSFLKAFELEDAVDFFGWITSVAQKINPLAGE